MPEYSDTQSTDGDPSRVLESLEVCPLKGAGFRDEREVGSSRNIFERIRNSKMARGVFALAAVMVMNTHITKTSGHDPLRSLGNPTSSEVSGT